jgi:hypothetical protein
MLDSRRLVAMATTAIAVVVSTIALAAPADALVVPLWPAEGRVPTGCDQGITWTPVTATARRYAFTDSGTPHVTGVHIGTGASRTSVLTPAGGSLVAKVFLTEPCSGVGAVSVGVSHNGTVVVNGRATPATTDAFTATRSSSFAVTPSRAGIYKVFATRVYRRYDAMTLDQDFRLVSVTPGTSGGSVDIGPWAATPFYVLRATMLSSVLSATKLAKGRTVTATARLTMASDVGYVGDGGAKVLVQTKVGTGAWITNATLTTSPSGVASYSFVLSATTQVRFLHKSVLSGKFTHGVVSAIRTVTRI